MSWSLAALTKYDQKLRKKLEVLGDVPAGEPQREEFLSQFQALADQIGRVADRYQWYDVAHREPVPAGVYLWDVTRVIEERHVAALFAIPASVRGPLAKTMFQVQTYPMSVMVKIGATGKTRLMTVSGKGHVVPTAFIQGLELTSVRKGVVITPPVKALLAVLAAKGPGTNMIDVFTGNDHVATAEMDTEAMKAVGGTRAYRFMVISDLQSVGDFDLNGPPEIKYIQKFMLHMDVQAVIDWIMAPVAPPVINAFEPPATHGLSPRDDFAERVGWAEPAAEPEPEPFECGVYVLDVTSIPAEAADVLGIATGVVQTTFTRFELELRERTTEPVRTVYVVVAEHEEEYLLFLHGQYHAVTDQLLHELELYKVATPVLSSEMLKVLDQLQYVHGDTVLHALLGCSDDSSLLALMNDFLVDLGTRPVATIDDFYATRNAGVDLLTFNGQYDHNSSAVMKYVVATMLRSPRQDAIVWITRTVNMSDVMILPVGRRYPNHVLMYYNTIKDTTFVECDPPDVRFNKFKAWVIDKLDRLYRFYAGSDLPTDVPGGWFDDFDNEPFGFTELMAPVDVGDWGDDGWRSDGDGSETQTTWGPTEEDRNYRPFLHYTDESARKDKEGERRSPIFSTGDAARVPNAFGIAMRGYDGGNSLYGPRSSNESEGWHHHHALRVRDPPASPARHSRPNLRVPPGVPALRRRGVPSGPPRRDVNWNDFDMDAALRARTEERTEEAEEESGELDWGEAEGAGAATW
jgi:hypothetical protein